MFRDVFFIFFGGRVWRYYNFLEEEGRDFKFVEGINLNSKIICLS